MQFCRHVSAMSYGRPSPVNKLVSSGRATPPPMSDLGCWPLRLSSFVPLTQAARAGPPWIDLAHGDTNVGITPIKNAPRRRPPIEAASIMREIKRLGYCGTPSMAKARNFPYWSPIFRASLYSGELRQA
jgi:hypothetical protein